MRARITAAVVAALALVGVLSVPASAAGTTHRWTMTADTSLSVMKPRLSFTCNDATGKWKVKARNIQPIVPLTGTVLPAWTVWPNLSVAVYFDRSSFGQDLPHYDPPYHTRGFVYVSLFQNDTNGLFEGEATGTMNPADCSAGSMTFTDYSFGDPDRPFSAGLLRVDGQVN